MQPEPGARGAAPDGVVAGWLFLASALVTLVAVAHHPTLHVHRAAQVPGEIARLTSLDEVVHGTLIAVTFALMYAATVFALRRGLSDQTVLGGLVAYAAGSSGITTAALIDGFAVPSVAGIYASTPDAALGALRVCGAAIQIATAFGFAALSIAIVLWATGLLRTPTVAARATGAIGVLAAVLPAVVYLATGATFRASTLPWLVLPEAVWYVALGLLLIRRLT